ncbi:MAG: HAD family phosphatase [Oscillospiraceae bacterium]|nr:HAD family phosphatase [Oscillospiraceae bacterium]
MALTIYHPQWGENRPIRGVLFDMDGLVVDTEKLYSRFWREACGFYGYRMSYEQSLKMRGLGGQAGEAMLHSFFGEEADYLQLRSKRIELMGTFVDEHGVELKPGILELMDFLEEKGIPAAITSSSPVSRIRKFLAPYGLDTRFRALCSGRDVPRGKPAPDIYLAGAAALGLPAESCLALEDAPAGVESAFRAGCLTVMVPDLDPPGEKVKAMLYGQADCLSDIPQLW